MNSNDITTTYGKTVTDGDDGHYIAKHRRLTNPQGTLKGLIVFRISSNCFKEINVYLSNEKDRLAFALACKFFSKLSGIEKKAFAQTNSENNDMIRQETISQYRFSLKNKLSYISAVLNNVELSNVCSKLLNFTTRFWKKDCGIVIQSPSQTYKELKRVDTCLYKVFAMHVKRHNIPFEKLEALCPNPRATTPNHYKLEFPQSDPPDSHTPIDWSSSLLYMTKMKFWLTGKERNRLRDTVVKVLIYASAQLDTFILQNLLESLRTSDLFASLNYIFFQLVSEKKYLLLTDLFTSIHEHFKEGRTPSCLFYDMYPSERERDSVVKFVKENRKDISPSAVSLFYSSFVSHAYHKLGCLLLNGCITSDRQKEIEIQIAHLREFYSRDTTPAGKLNKNASIAIIVSGFLDILGKGKAYTNLVPWLLTMIFDLTSMIEDECIQMHLLKQEIRSARNYREDEWDLVNNLNEPLKSRWIELMIASGERLEFYIDAETEFFDD